MKFDKPHDINLPTAALGLAATPDRKLLYAACMDGQIFEVDPATQQRTAFATAHTSYASGCVLLPDGDTLISGGYDGALIWHSVKTRQSIRKVAAHHFWSWQLALSPDGKQVASVTGQYLAGDQKYHPAPATEPTVKIFDTHTGELVQHFDHLPPVMSVAFSPDGKHLAAANLMGETKVWELASGKVVATFASEAFTVWGIIKSSYYLGGISGLIFTPDGHLLSCGMGPVTDPMAGNGKTVWQKWQWRDGTPKMLSQIKEGDGGTGHMETLAFLPDGQSFLMAGREAQSPWNAAIFSAKDGSRLATLDTKSRITRALFSPDGRTAYLAAARGQSRDKATGKWADSGRIHVVGVEG